MPTRHTRLFKSVIKASPTHLCEPVLVTAVKLSKCNKGSNPFFARGGGAAAATVFGLKAQLLRRDARVLAEESTKGLTEEQKAAVVASFNEGLAKKTN